MTLTASIHQHMQRNLFFLTVLAIIYGSLYPFEFSYISDASRQAFWHSFHAFSSSGDILGNTVLFVPYGLLGYRILPNGLLTFYGLLLAFGLQVVQLYLPARDPAIFDVYWNLLGGVLGVFAARLSGGYAWQHSGFSSAEQQVALVVLAFWLAFQWLPFVPTLDWQAYKNALKPLWIDAHVDLKRIAFLAIGWLVVSTIVASAFPRWSPAYFAGGAFLALVAKIAIVTNQLALNDFLGGAIGVWLNALLTKDRVRLGGVFAWLLLGAYVLDGSEPFWSQTSGKPFVWMPFAGFLEGSMITNSKALAEKSFVFAAAFLLLRNAGSLSLVTITAMVFLVAMSEISQLWQIGRTAEITDPLLALFFAYLAKKTQKSFFAASAPSLSPANRTAIKLLESVESCVVGYAGPSAGAAYGGSSWRIIGVALATGLVIVLGTYALLRLPGIPYNVRELFKYGGNGFDLAMFASALLLMGAGPAWTGKCSAAAKWPIVAMPVFAILVSVVIYLAFFLSVTEESLMDIAGTSVVVHRVGEKGVLGQMGKDFVNSVGAENLRLITDIVEPPFRFGALIGPVVMILELMFFSTYKYSVNLNSGKPFSFKFFAGFLIAFLYMLPWFYFCKVLAFDWSSTDNLNELIARDGEYGLGGGGYIYLLVALICFSSVLLAWGFFGVNRYYFWLAIFASILSVYPGWILINAGLTDNVGKYGLSFSGVDFLLGPDRRHLLSKAELFLRWSVVQTATIWILASGSALYLKWASFREGEVWKSSKASFGVFTELHGQLGIRQLKFLDSLVLDVNKNISELVCAIISFVGKEVSVSESAKEAIVRELKSQANMHHNCASLPIALYLPPKQMKILTELKLKSGVDNNVVLNGLISIFMLALGQED